MTSFLGGRALGVVRITKKRVSTPCQKFTFLEILSIKSTLGNGKVAALPTKSSIKSTMVRRNRTLRQQYAPHLRRSMSWKDSHPYADGTEFTDAQLLEIRPNHLLRYMSLIAYGTSLKKVMSRQFFTLLFYYMRTGRICEFEP